MFLDPLSSFQPSSTVDDLSVYGDKRFQFPYSAAPGRQWIPWRLLSRRWRRRGEGGGTFVSGWSGAGGGQVARKGRVQSGGASDPVHRRCGPAS